MKSPKVGRQFVCIMIVKASVPEDLANGPAGTSGTGLTPVVRVAARPADSCYRATEGRGPSPGPEGGQEAGGAPVGGQGPGGT